MADYSPNYLAYNGQVTKKLNVVMAIDGITTLFTLQSPLKQPVYGDPTITYGEAGLYYGEGVPYPSSQFLNCISLESNLTVGQTIEPEQGRGNVATMTIVMVDINQQITKLVSPGILVDEPLGNRLVTIKLGYQETSYPNDYVRIFVGYITSTKYAGGKWFLQLSDSTAKQRAQIFYSGTTSLISDVTAGATLIPVVQTQDFFQSIPGPDGAYDSSLLTYIQIDDEVMKYNPVSGIVSAPFFTFVVSGANATAGATYSNNGFVFTVINTIVAGSVLFCSGTGSPLSTGTLTKTSGTGDATISFSASAASGTGAFTVTRGQRGTAAAAHTNTTNVINTFQLQGNGIDLALKMMLSGWDGPFVTGITCLAIQDTLGAGLVTNSLLFDASIDVIDKFGLVIGDWLTISGSSFGNNGSYKIGAFGSLNGGTNNQILIATSFPADESPATNVLIAFRSQYDTLPINMGLKMSPMDVDVPTWVSIKNLFFSQTIYSLQFYITDRTDGKSFIEKEIMLPFGCYTINKFGRLSMTASKPPIAGATLSILDKTTVLDPANISIERATNGRSYFNEIQYRYDVLDDNSTFTNVNTLDAGSTSLIQITSVLPIESLGMRTSLNAAQLIQNRGIYLLNRYKNAAVEINLVCNWKAGSIIETGDIVLLNDNGDLQIPNFVTGVRNLGSQLFEVIDRKYDIKAGRVSLTLLGNIAYQSSDRFGSIAPSSNVGTGSTTTRVLIQDSYGALYPGNEQQKWIPIIGTKVVIHSPNYTTYNQTSTLIGFDPTNPYIMILSPALSLAPSAGYIVEVNTYPNNTDATDSALDKLLWSYIDPTVSVVTGVSGTQFTVSSGDAAKFVVNQPVIVHNATYSVLSLECLVQSIVGTTITLASNLGFTPNNTYKVELIGFIDGGGPYRIL